ncbi:hypothetical protein D0867_10042 [Hortaea werneckii]|uniref:RRM domain-containing protein n=1 Tax=Hortaea werneckii TaxID=91943 RepID=A0A3M6YQW6_HORWE|nr:hypothetical protein D0867_10042 [Hortaea werneckii]
MGHHTNTLLSPSTPTTHHNMSRGGTTLYVTGFGHGTRARDLAYEFERVALPAPLTLRAVSSHSGIVLTISKVWTSRPLRYSSTAYSLKQAYESRRDADDAYYEMHNKRIGRDDLLKIEWARTPPSASWRFDAGRPPRRERSPRGGGGSRRSVTPTRRSRYDDEDRRERDYDSRRDERRRDRTRSPEDRDRDMKDRDREEDREREHRDRDYEQNGANGDDRKERDEPAPAHDDLDTAE